jgi:hypothetical protein
LPRIATGFQVSLGELLTAVAGHKAGVGGIDGLLSPAPIAVLADTTSAFATVAENSTFSIVDMRAFAGPHLDNLYSR